MKELMYLAELSNGKRTKIKFWAFTSRSVLAQCQGIVKMLEKAGIEVYADTCMVVSPLEKIGFRRVVTNSAKAAKYLRDLRGLDVMILPLEDIVERFLTATSSFQKTK
jgi:predicted aconitase